MSTQWLHRPTAQTKRPPARAQRREVEVEPPGTTMDAAWAPSRRRDGAGPSEGMRAERVLGESNQRSRCTDTASPLPELPAVYRGTFLAGSKRPLAPRCPTACGRKNHFGSLGFM